MEIKRIIIGTDFSPGADLAFKEGLRLASRHGAELRIINVLPLRFKPNPDFLPDIDLAQTGEGELAEACQAELESRYLWRAKGLNARAMVISGEPAKTLCNEVETWEADLLVIGPHGRAKLREKIFGTVSKRLLRHTACSVLVVKSPDNG